MREIVLDTETTGLDPKDGHRIIEIGLVELEGHLPTGRSFHTLLNPERPLDAGAIAVHGITDAMLAGAPLFAEKVEEFLNFIRDDILIIHNAAFDMGFLNAELSRHGFPSLDRRRAIDTVLLARQKFPGMPANLDALCRRFNIDLSVREKHGALIDAKLLAEVYLELLGGRQSALSLDAAAEKRETEHQQQQYKEGANIIRAVRAHAPTEAELAKHAEFMASIKGALWDKFKPKQDAQIKE